MEESHSTPTENEEVNEQATNELVDQNPPEVEQETDENQFARLMAEKKARKEGKAPEPTPEPTPEPVEAQEPEAEKPQETEHDDFSRWPEAARAEISRLQAFSQQQYRDNEALRGRLAPMQRLVEDLRKQLHEQQSAPPPTLKDLEDNDAFKEIHSEFPEEAEALKKVFGSQAQVLQQAAQQAQALQQALEAERKQQVQRELQRLQVRYPNYLQIRNHPLFGQWKEARPDHAARLNTTDSDLVISALDQFKRDLAQVDKTAFAQLFPTAVQSQAPKPNRPAPPKPSPPSQGSGMSGAPRPSAPMTAEQQFAEYLASKRRS